MRSTAAFCTASRGEAAELAAVALPAPRAASENERLPRAAVRPIETCCACGLLEQWREDALLLAALSTPRRIWSSSMLSNSALKLPLPKPSSPLRWMNSKKIGPSWFSLKICSSSASFLPSIRILRVLQLGHVSRRGPGCACRPARSRCRCVSSSVTPLARSASTVRVEVVGAHRDVLDAFALVHVQVLPGSGRPVPCPLR